MSQPEQKRFVTKKLLQNSLLPHKLVAAIDEVTVSQKSAFEVKDFELELQGEDEPLRFSNINKLTVNFDTRKGDGVGGTVVVNSKRWKNRGFHSGAPVTEVRWFDFSEDKAEEAAVIQLCESLRHFDVKVDKRNYDNRLFKRIFLNISE